MKTMMKKTAAYLLALLLVIQIVPASADTTYSGIYTQKDVTYRDAIEITPELDIDILKVGMQNQLTVSDDYKNIAWESDHPEIATVSETGLVEAVGAGKVTITVISEGQYKDTISFKIVGDAQDEEPENEPAGQSEESGDGQDGEQAQNEKLIIFIKGNKTKTEYNGTVQKNTYTVTTSNDELFDENKLTMSEDHLAAESNCGIWQDNMSEKDFVYDGTAEIVVSNGWINIKPVQIEIKADDITIEEGESPAFTASVVSGLVEGETLDLSGIEFTTMESNGETGILPNVSEGDIIGNYKVKKVISGKLTVIKTEELPLYNLAEISGKWYRLAKSTFRTSLGDVSKYFGKTIDKSKYPTERYDFTDLEIEIEGKKYVYSCDKNAEAILNGANYYTATVKNLEAIKDKIGGMDGNNPRWLIPESQRYNDDNKTSGYHMNYTIKLVENKTAAVDQRVYNMLSVDGSTDYYKLRTTNIKAKTLENYTNSHLAKGEYILERYNFSGVTVTIDGVEYKYNDGSLDEYENYFTVVFDEVQKVNMFNHNATWFKKAESWLDGAYEEYGNLPNNTVAFHANYNATTHKAEVRKKSVTIHSDWQEGRIAFPGAKITLTATAVGFGDNVKFQWQRSAGGGVWENIPGETGITYTYILNDSTAQYVWRVVAED